MNAKSSFIFSTEVWLILLTAENRIKMPDSETKAVIGLSWEPKIPSLSASSSGSKSKSLLHETSGSLYRPNSELIDGLYVPPNDPKKLKKLLKKQVKDTAGKNWYLSFLFCFKTFPCWFFHKNLYWASWSVLLSFLQ